MANNVFTELQQLLAEPNALKAHFFPTSAQVPSVGGARLPSVPGTFPLRDLINSDVSTPKLPLTISAIRDLITSVGTDEMKLLDGNLLDAITSGNPASALKAILNVPQNLHTVADLGGALLVRQLTIGASLLSIISALDPSNAKNLFNSVHEAHSQYFFAEAGFTTVAEQKISPPDLATGAQTDFFSQKTGERYVRDLTRVGFEAVANDTWDLIGRYNKIVTTGAIIKKDKAKAWFKGYSDFAEASVTSAVEQALSQGGGPVQANPLLAAGIATAAGTAARKATQHVFLQEIGL
jgi:hypothetical protein